MLAVAGDFGRAAALSLFSASSEAAVEVLVAAGAFRASTRPASDLIGGHLPFGTTNFLDADRGPSAQRVM